MADFLSNSLIRMVFYPLHALRDAVVWITRLLLFIITSLFEMLFESICILLGKMAGRFSLLAGIPDSPFTTMASEEQERYRSGDPEAEELSKRIDKVNEAIKLNREVHLLFVLVGIYLAILFGSTWVAGRAGWRGLTP